MRRVRAIHLLRAVSSVAVSAALLVLALWTIGREVWVSKVVENILALANPSSMLAYLASAFLHTNFLVQVLSVLVIAVTIWMARELARVASSFAHFA
jgi:hypothetical protein